ncbi:hypothetical protein BCR43DRAFT_490257 [Syncephalastrum racemosum]|uniref:Uncharacterized protein n=1 Tax=Syncephalastrum racemosum TaxID=13706 RepID=A0A1X2HFI7_SYNRA|nr:hypothetical protein BCR43DRAFT_490257 [Syncephalastrum racemosum]
MRGSGDRSAWNERLFEAMMEDEGQDPFYTQFYEQPTSSSSRMTDEEYRQYMVSGMNSRKRGRHAVFQDELDQEEEAQRKEEKKRKKQQEKEEKERQQRIFDQLQGLRKEKEDQDHSKAYNAYQTQWQQVEAGTHKNVPWPKASSAAELRPFLVRTDLSRDENRKRVRLEQKRYHPDKFMHRVTHLAAKEQTRLVKRATELSSWLNDLWSELS